MYKRLHNCIDLAWFDFEMQQKKKLVIDVIVKNLKELLQIMPIVQTKQYRAFTLPSTITMVNENVDLVLANFHTFQYRHLGRMSVAKKINKQQRSMFETSDEV